MKMKNTTSSVVKFQIDGAPGAPPDMYEVEPGKSVELPDEYVEAGTIGKIAPGLSPATTETVMERLSGKASKKKDK